MNAAIYIRLIRSGFGSGVPFRESESNAKTKIKKMDSGFRRNDGGFPASRRLFNDPEPGGAAVDFTGFGLTLIVF